MVDGVDRRDVAASGEEISEGDLEMNIDALRTEIDTDPLTRGYAGMSDEQVADSLNNVINRKQNKTAMTASEVFNAIDKTEFDALSNANEAKIWNVLSMGTLNPFGLEAAIFTDVFSDGSTTITALKAARKTDVSRGVELGLGFVRPGNVLEAR